MDRVKVFAPATVGNVGPGFDILGLCLESVGDTIELERRTDSKLVIQKITGAELPYDPKQNLIGVVLEAMLQDLDLDVGLSIGLEKNVLPGSGLGSSASSAAGAAVALNMLLGEPFGNLKLTEFAMLGEEFVSHKAHADNVAPCIYGGMTLIRSYDPLEIISIPMKKIPYIAVVHPQIEVKTSIAKKLMRESIKLENAVTQWGNVAGLVAGMITGDLELAGRCISTDMIAEPVRSILIPFYKDSKEVALKSGAFGFNISGSGPSMFAMCDTIEIAQSVNSQIEEIYGKAGIPVKSYVSAVSTKGVVKVS